MAPVFYKRSSFLKKFFILLKLQFFPRKLKTFLKMWTISKRIILCVALVIALFEGCLGGYGGDVCGRPPCSYMLQKHTGTKKLLKYFLAYFPNL